ncbi:MAG TPA: sensor histidine kinase [Nitrosospira sp.]|nr:sensor histidine kinase [Nitrosospira sp.]
MRLADFILRDMEAILAAWEAFAAVQLPAARHMDPLALRDHARQILQAVSRDLSTSQSREAQTAKSLGRAPILIGAPETAAQIHALLRARSGFDINQLTAEYRALRASVLRLWGDDSPLESTHLDDIIRFNEAIDQALAESVAFFSREVDQGRNLFLGMLGHDLRNPLQTIQMTASYLAALNAGAKVSEAAGYLINSGRHMHALLDDLLDFNRTNLGLGINITPSDIDLSQLCASALDQLRAANPGRKIDLEVNGDTCGNWDSQRLQQLLGNLVRNAIKYGAADAPVCVDLNGDAAGIVLEVRNSGPVIEPLDLDQIFNPLKRGSDNENKRAADGSLGLGLYIAREIAKGHGGSIEARSDETETVFAVRLPRTYTPSQLCRS